MMLEIAKQKIKLLKNTLVDNTEEGSMGELLKVSLPLMISQSSWGMMLLTERIILSPLGTVYPASSMLGGFVASSLWVFITGYLCYLTVLTGQYTGAGQRDRLSRLLLLGIFISFLAWPVMILLNHFLVPLYFDWLGVSALESALAQSYTNILIWTAPETFLNVVFACFLSGLGRTKIVMKAQVIMMLINIPISYTLIFLFGLEVKGAALGSVISGSIGAALMAYDIFKKESREDIGLDKIFAQKSMRAIFTLDMDMIKTYVRYGAPMAFEFTFILLAFNTFVGLFHSYGEAQALAMTIVYNWDFLLFMPMWGVNMGLSTLVGKFMGARRPDLARLSTSANFKVNMVLTTGISIFLLIYADWAVKVFLTAKDVDTKAVMELALPMLRLAIFYFFAMAISLALSGTLRAAGDTRFCLVITASAHWLNLLFAFWAIKIAFWPPLQTWSVHVWIYWIEVVFFVYRYLQGPWESIEMVENLELGGEVSN